MSTFSITTSRKLTIVFLIELILRNENITFFELFKHSVLTLLFVMSKLLERSVIASVVYMSVFKNNKFSKQSSRFLENSLLSALFKSRKLLFKLFSLILSLST